MIYLKNEEEIAYIKESSLLVSAALAVVADVLRPGITPLKIDKVAEEFIRDHQGVPAFKGYNGFPASLCISVNETVVHGIPNNQELKPGDLVSVDCGVLKNQFYGDSAFTFVLGDPPEALKKLVSVTKQSLYLAINQAVAGHRVGDISAAVQEYTEKKHGYGVVRELVGHGIGRNLHEAPEIPNFGKKGKGPILKEGITLAIEPMINMGTPKIKQLKDGWTIITADRLPSAHFEHTVVVRKSKAEILSDFEIIENSIKKNKELAFIP